MFFTYQLYVNGSANFFTEWPIELINDNNNISLVVVPEARHEGFSFKMTVAAQQSSNLFFPIDSFDFYIHRFDFELRQVRVEFNEVCNIFTLSINCFPKDIVSAVRRFQGVI